MAASFLQPAREAIFSLFVVSLFFPGAVRPGAAGRWQVPARGKITIPPDGNDAPVRTETVHSPAGRAAQVYRRAAGGANLSDNKVLEKCVWQR